MLVVNSLTFGPTAHKLTGDGFSLMLSPGQIAVLFGPSGVGKTTLMRAICGQAFIRKGKIELFGKNITHAALNQRQLAYMEQNFPLFDELTVAENIRLQDVRLSGGLKPDAAAAARTALSGVSLPQDFDQRRPHTLSGGEKQRVALARALASGQRLLLLDEPFSNLDPSSKARAMSALLRYVHDHEAMALVVCHDDFDAVQLADVLYFAPFDADARPTPLGRNTDLTEVARSTGFGVPGAIQEISASSFRDANGGDTTPVRFISTDAGVTHAPESLGDGYLIAPATIEAEVRTPVGILTTLRLTKSGETAFAFAPANAEIGALGDQVFLTLKAT